MEHIVEFEKIVKPIIEANGFEIVEIKEFLERKALNFTIFIYKKEGITLDDCVFVNNVLEQPLEKFKIDTPYVLNVSSPGLDRPIITDDDYRRNIGIEVEAIVLSNNDKMIGKLLKKDNEQVFIGSKKGVITIQTGDIKCVKPYINLKEILKQKV